MRFKWGALLAVAALSWLAFCAAGFFIPYTSGIAIDSLTGRRVYYTAILDLKRVAVTSEDTEASRLIQAYPAPPGSPGGLLAYDSCWVMLRIGWVRFKPTLGMVQLEHPARTEIDEMIEFTLDNLADYLDDAEWQQSDGMSCGFTPAGKAQLMRNMLEVLHRGRPEHYVNRMVIPQLMRPLDHPAGPEEVPSASQIIRKNAQLF